MLVAGIDVGAATAKALIMGGGSVLSYFIMPTGASVKQAAEVVFEESLRRAGVQRSNLDYVLATGWGRHGVGFANKTATEIWCHAKGIHFLIPGASSIIDIGGQDSKAINIDDEGDVVNFIMNDKCAAGTGRFCEVMAVILHLKIEDLGEIALSSDKPVSISSTCTVFAETELVAHRAEGESVENLTAGVMQSIAKRVAGMALQIRPTEKAVFTGGVAKNIGVKKFLEKELGLELIVPEEPQITGALGAALVAKTELEKSS